MTRNARRPVRGGRWDRALGTRGTGGGTARLHGGRTGGGGGGVTLVDARARPPPVRPPSRTASLFDAPGVTRQGEPGQAGFHADFPSHR